jgi:predicted dehydrogenase
MTKPLRVAIVGCGRMGAFTRPELRERLGPRWLPLNYAEAVAAVDGLELTAFCDLDAEALRRAQETHGVAAGYDDHRRMLADERPDIVVVATRTRERPQILIDAAESGVRGLHGEKPLSISLAETRSVAEALTSNGTAFTYGTLRRYMPMYHEAAAELAAGRIGELQQIVVKFGRGALLWTHAHSVDLLCRFAGTAEARSVQSLLDLSPEAVSGRRIDADPVVLSASIHFANGCLGTITVGAGLDLELMGSNGQLTIYGDGAWRWLQPAPEQSPEGEPPPLEPQRPASPLSPTVLALQELRDCLRGRRRPSLGIAEVVAQQRLLFAIAESHLLGGAAINPEEVDERLQVTGLTHGRLV